MAREIPRSSGRGADGDRQGGRRQARREGNVPGIVYGDGKDPSPINIELQLPAEAPAPGPVPADLFNLKVEGQPDTHVICRGVQRDVVKDLPTHVDFMRIHDESRINLFIHVDFVNQDKSPGLKRGGTLTIVRHEVELEVTAGDIPDHITVDLTGKQIGDVIHINDIDCPKGAKPTVARNFAVANIAAPSGLAASAGEEAEA
jgi:large subunit ribosomal protein L25